MGSLRLVSSTGTEPDGFFRGFASEAIEQRGRDEQTQESRADQAADDDDGDGVEDFLARFIRGQHQRDEGETGRERGHQDGDQAFLGAPGDHFRGEPFTLVLHQVKVVGDEHDVVPCRNTTDGDESDQGCDAHIVQGHLGVEDGSDQGDRNDRQHQADEAEALEIGVEQEDDARA